MSLNHTKPLKLKKGGMHRRRPTLTLILRQVNKILEKKLRQIAVIIK